MRSRLSHSALARLSALSIGALLLASSGSAAFAASAGAQAPDPAGLAQARSEVVRPPVTKTPSGHRVVPRPTAAQIAAAASAPRAAAAATGSTSFSYSSEDGDYIGQGQSRTFTASDDIDISVRGTRERLSLSMSDTDFTTWWSVDLAAGAGETLHPGSYLNAERYPFQTGRSPGLNADGDGRGCNQVYGNFIVNQIAFDDAGIITMADVDFVQHCERSTAPAFRGTIHYNQLPLSYSQVSDAGDYIGGGASKTYLNSTSIIAVRGNAAGFSLSVSGLRDSWDGTFRAPDGESLTAGTTYRTTRFGDDTNAGLDFSGNGRGCNSSTGTLTIKAIEFDPDGAVTNLSAVFEQHCEGDTPALHGTLRYFA